jgi:predicted O-methyltransferase YrrM
MKFLAKLLIKLLAKIAKRYRLANYIHGDHFEISIIKEPTFKSELKNGIIDFNINILHELRKDFKFNRSTGTAWDGLVGNQSGEHYKILPAIVRSFKAKYVIEIGTFMGACTYSILENTDADIATFDIVPWNESDSYLIHSDFNGGRLCQFISDLSIEREFNKNLELFYKADLIFLDAPKDGVFEYKFWNLIIRHQDIFKGKVIVMDDIRVGTMIDLWDSIYFPKIDIGSIGHWSGTGLVFVE